MEHVLPCHIGTDDSAGEPCAICFETRPSMTLPCACKAAYCASCWNQAMASSVKRRGQAQCPSCRMAFLIDLDPDSGRILFSKQDGGTHQNQWQPRLSKKTKLVQIRLLKRYGSVAKHQIAAANVDTASPCIEVADTMDELTLQMLKPMCVCGGFLEHVTYKKRFFRLNEEFGVDWNHRTCYVISCNLCDTVVPQRSSLWTCEDGCRSVLHPTSYDICESCFSKHAGAASQGSGSYARCTAFSKPIFLFKCPW